MNIIANVFIAVVGVGLTAIAFTADSDDPSDRWTRPLVAVIGVLLVGAAFVR